MKSTRATRKAAAPVGDNQGIRRFFMPITAKPSVSSVDHTNVVSRGPVEAENEPETESAVLPTASHPASTQAQEANEATRDDISEADDSDHDQAASVCSAVSEYERKRLARVAMNAQFLKELGMKTTQWDVSTAVQRTTRPPGATPKKKRLRDESDMVVSTVSTRRSSRLKGIPVDGQQRGKRDDDVDDEPVNEPLFDDSSVFKYLCDRRDATGTSERRSRPDGAALVGFRGSSECLGDPNLRRIYSISFSPSEKQPLIATGGHQGHVSIYASPPSFSERGDEEAPPLMSFRAHRGWISSLSLARSSADGVNLLLSAANDGVVKLWDLNHQSARGEPKELMSVEDLHRTGIFSMDVVGDTVLTCSKDSTIAVSTFRETTNTLTVSRRYDDHDSVVKSARFSGPRPQWFASGGNDKCVRVFDTRDSATKASQVIVDAHARVINSVVWHPTQEHLLLSASFDPDMHLYDLRHPAKPVHVLSSLSSHAGNAIFHPCFVADGDYIVSTGAGSQDHLTLHRTTDGTTVSRGQLPAKASYVSFDPSSDRLLVAMGQQLQFFDCDWQDA